MKRTRVVIAGAAGRDFHDFNMVYRRDAAVEVVAFTATQIPGIERRRYPPSLAGALYPQGIPIVPESELESLKPDRVVFAYSDVSHAEVMHLASRALAIGADFELLGPARTMIRALGFEAPAPARAARRGGAPSDALRRSEADVIVWDGGNNDFPFVRPELHIVMVDALRPDHGVAYHPGEACLRMADVVVISKVDVAPPVDTAAATELARRMNPHARIVRANFPVRLDDPDAVTGRRALVIEDGPTITHGGMRFGAGMVAARAAGATIVDPRPFAAPAIREVLEQHPHIESVLPAMGYSPAQLEALVATINASPADVVVSATPIDLARLLHPGKPVVRARYEFEDASAPGLEAEIDAFVTALVAI